MNAWLNWEVTSSVDGTVTVIETAEADEFDGDTLDAWMRVMNDLRLVLGTNLNVSESVDWSPPPELESMYVVYQWLSILLGHIVEAQLPDEIDLDIDPD